MKRCGLCALQKLDVQLISESYKVYLCDSCARAFFDALTERIVRMDAEEENWNEAQ
jgi:hypothetical protein